jgi:hypothetical protein
MKKTRTRLTVQISIDVDAWNAEYGTADQALDVREQVKDYLQDAMNESVRHLGGSVRIRRPEAVLR